MNCAHGYKHDMSAAIRMILQTCAPSQQIIKTRNNLIHVPGKGGLENLCVLRHSSLAQMIN